MDSIVNTKCTPIDTAPVQSDKRVVTSHETTYQSGSSQSIPPLKGFNNAVFSRTHGVPISYDEWYSENEEHLLDMWHGINSIVYDRGLFMLDKSGYQHFCTFVASKTTLAHNPHASGEYDDYEEEY